MNPLYTASRDDDDRLLASTGQDQRQPRVATLTQRLAAVGRSSTHHQLHGPSDDEFDFRVVGSVVELDRMIRSRAATGATARLVAGFCWPWSEPDEAGPLVPDVRVGDWSMPYARKLGPGIPSRTSGRATPTGSSRSAASKTAHGFEFGYVGVIVAPDLVYRTLDGGWVGQRDQSHDRIVRSGVTDAEFTDFVKSTYRVLLTRGLRGCYVYFIGPSNARLEPDRATGRHRSPGRLRSQRHTRDYLPPSGQKAKEGPP